MKSVVLLKLIVESFRFAWSALMMNLFRTVLSLLGVTVGIFAIISVFTVVDSLESSIRSSFNFLGDKVIRVEKWPFGLGGEYPWWKYMRRPLATYQDYEFLHTNLSNYSAMTISSARGGQTVKRESNSINAVTILGVSQGYSDVYEVPVEKGRYFTYQELINGRNVCVVGANLVDALFPNEEPIGKTIKIRGLNHFVIGVLEREGESFLGGLPTNDDNCYIPYADWSKMYYSGSRFGGGATIAIKGRETDIGLVELENEVTGLMRRKRGLKPREEDDFAINRPEALQSFIGSTFDIITVAGWIIGGFSILVGGFGIANIMFVSVKERTHIIGIQKSLGAKNYFILFQFLFEAIFLSVIGGGFGLLLVYFLSFMSLGSLELSLSIRNVAIGLGVSSIIGTVAGIVPAALAARLDPVEAIRMQ
ncbi:MAG TPA: ABC transporter permease [Cyclobacteriaceae bacterium]|jgi:putative ABC transport system permease protein